MWYNSINGEISKKEPCVRDRQMAERLSRSEMYSYLMFLMILIPFLVFSAYASAKVNSAYAAFDKVPNRSNMTGYDAAVRLMQNRGVRDIRVERINGKLSDHYNPAKKLVNLSASTYGSTSVAAVAVAAHEIGHVMQKQEGYVPYKIRNFLVPLTNIGSRLALPLVIVGVVLDILQVSFWSVPSIGRILVYIGIAFYGLATLFMLATLPVEFNASSRAKKMLVEDGILARDEVTGASKVLSAAALTYVASLLISFVYFLRFALIFLAMLRRD